MTDYLDVRKSVIISAPAGSGKTERLSRRYISLVLSGSEPEKILAITFTEKAAAEMKDRILRIIMREEPDLFEKIKEKIPLMRITTIHAFCRKLITRFSLELGLDPTLDVLDEFGASRLWSESVYDALRDEKDRPSAFFEYLKLKGIKGWDLLYRTLEAIHGRRPYSEFLSEDQGILGPEERSLLDLYGRCLAIYRQRKSDARVIDFNDMEVLAYRAIASNPQWLNILYAFDEHTDHILVDEFQDTNTIQWRIIDRLTEEWRSGLGAKRSAGKTPTIFLVGDEKQSIYMFRGANVSIFHEVREKFREWLGEDAVYIEARENYRSLPKIIDFANRLFSHHMQGSLAEAWRTRYADFSATREGEGSIELLLMDAGRNSKETRLRESDVIAARIVRMAGNLEVFREGTLKKCRYGDIAILLRSRTHLTAFEGALRSSGVPYIVVGGIGFYDEPEVAILRELVSFLADPRDDFSLFAVLRSPLAGLSEQQLYGLMSGRKSSLYEAIQSSGSSGLREISEQLARYISRIHVEPLSIILEDFLVETRGWEVFWETQRHANIRKFLRIVEGYDAESLHPFEIKEKLIQSRRSNEPKANVNAENLDAVRIMTVHGAKGLQFPVVFLPSLDEAVSSRTGSVFIGEVDRTVRFAYEEDPARRNRHPFFATLREKEQEEEKRLFYVAVTRAMDHLVMSGSVKRDAGPAKIKGKLAMIEEAFPGSVSAASSYAELFTVATEADFGAAARPAAVFEHDSRGFFQEPVCIEPVAPSSKAVQWMDVTESIDVRTRHGDDWVSLGIVFHRLFEEIAQGVTPTEEIEKRAGALLRHEDPSSSDIDRKINIIVRDFRKLDESGYLKEIIMQPPSSGGIRAYAELPFILQKGNTVYRGRIDRLIIKGDTAFVYDYKTFPASEREVEELRQKYRPQMTIYCEACNRLFGLKAEGYILFTHRPALVGIYPLPE